MKEDKKFSAGFLARKSYPTVQFFGSGFSFWQPTAKLATKTFAGFTLLELLVAMSVMAILLVLLLNIVNSATQLWRENENRVDSYREARAALSTMSRDLQNALTGASNTDHFLINASAFPLLVNESKRVTDTNSGAAIFFLSALPSKAQQSGLNRSDVCQVGYFMAHGKSSSVLNSPIETMNIYRYLLSSDETFVRLTNVSQPVFPDTLTAINPKVELLARNITRFTARAFTVTTHNTLSHFVATKDSPMPDLIELSITAINQDAGKKLASQTEWLSTNGVTYFHIIKPVEQTFTTRIRLSN